MSKNDEIDEQLLALAQSVEGRKLASLSEKVELTLRVDKNLKKRLQLVYGRSLSRMFEEAMLNRLMVDGHLGKPTDGPGSTEGSKAVSGAVEYFKPTKGKPGPQGKAVEKRVKKTPVWDPKTKEFLPDDDE